MCKLCVAQNIFDEDTEPENAAPEKPAASDDTAKAKIGSTARKKKKSRKKKKQPAPETSTPESTGLSPQDLARQSYAWAPEPGLQLKSTAPGIKPAQPLPTAPAVAAPPAEEPVSPGRAQGFRLPEIPVTQVLIVAGFVILFLIYRFRVSRQMKRRKY